MQDFINCHPGLMYEKANAADNAGDSEKSALYFAVAQLLELVELHEDKISDLESDINSVPDYSRYVEFFNDCFARLNDHYPCPEVTSDYDCNIIFEAIENGEAYDAKN